MSNAERQCQEAAPVGAATTTRVEGECAPRAAMPPAPSAREAAKLRKQERKERAAQKGPTPTAEGAASQPKGSAKKDAHQQDPAVQLSKAFAYMLRHGAEKEFLQVRADGFIRVDAILQRPRVRKIPMQRHGVVQEPNVDDVMAIAEANDKKRFEITSGSDTDPTADGAVLWIRAVQGHSLKSVVDLAHERITLENAAKYLPRFVDDSDVAAALGSLQLDGPIYYAIHGTDAAAWDSICESGALKRMGRNHIHLAKGRPGDNAVISGAWCVCAELTRRDAQVVQPAYLRERDRGAARRHRLRALRKRCCAHAGRRCMCSARAPLTDRGSCLCATCCASTTHAVSTCGRRSERRLREYNVIPTPLSSAAQ